METLKYMASMTMQVSYKFYLTLANLYLKIDTSVIKKLLCMFGRSWVRESTFLTINFMKSKNRFPVKIQYPNSVVLSV